MAEVNDLVDMHIDFVSLTKQGIDPDAHVTLAKAAAPGAHATTEVPMANKIPDALRKALGDAIADALTDEQTTDLNAAFDEASKPETDPDETDPKADPKTTPAAPAATETPEAEPVTETTEVGKSVIALQKSLDETQERLNAEVTAREEREFVTEHAPRYKNMGDGGEAVAKSVFAVRKGTATDEDHKRVDEALAGASTQLATTPAVGVERGTGAAADSGPSAEIAKMAKAYVEANPDTDEPTATAAVLRTQEGKAAYERYEIDRQARVHAAGGATSE